MKLYVLHSKTQNPDSYYIVDREIKKEKTNIDPEFGVESIDFVQLDSQKEQLFISIFYTGGNSEWKLIPGNQENFFIAELRKIKDKPSRASFN